MTIMRIAIPIFFAIFLSSCSVFMAAKQPDKKNVDLFAVGTHRSLLLAEFGMPTISELRDGRSTRFLNSSRVTASAPKPAGPYSMAQLMC